MQIELTNHTGISNTGQRVDFNQWIVMCDGTHIGYLQKTEGSWLACIVFMDEATKLELIESVSSAVGWLVGGAAIPVDPDFLNDEQGED